MASSCTLCFLPRVAIIGGYGVKFRQGLQFPIPNWHKDQTSSLEIQVLVVKSSRDLIFYDEPRLYQRFMVRALAWALL